MTHPAGKRFLMRKSSNAENLPPTALSASHAKKAQALVSAREASRRRRARVVSGSVALRKIVENAQRRASKAHARRTHVKLEPIQEPSPAVSETQETDASATHPAPAPQPAAGPSLELPRWLPRPAKFPQPFDRANIDACSEHVHGVPHKYILKGLEATGPSMWHLASNAKFDTANITHELPQELKVVIADYTMWAAATPMPLSFPTHVLALSEAPSEDGILPSVDSSIRQRKIRIMPIHNLVLAAHCAHWFPMPSKSDVEQKRVYVNLGGALGTALKLPVVPLTVPHIASFHQLLEFLYTHKVSKLLDHLVPVVRPPFVLPTASNRCPQNPHYIKETGRRLAARYNPWALVGMIHHVFGLWKNACSLGICDWRLWLAIDWSWDMLLTGLAYAVGRPEIVPRPQPRIFRNGATAAQRPTQQPEQQEPIRFEGLQRFTVPPTI
ncbi:hypothetical protein BD414DRAFT_577757 [Trametes punicea]|nr:hypothetical protein BD414DRAFT_577757 [Trametes punicea]